MLFQTILVLAYPKDSGLEPLRYSRGRGIAVSENDESVVSVLVGIFDRFLKRGASSAEYGYVLDYFLEAMYKLDSAVKLNHVYGFESISECAVDHAVEVLETFG